MTITTYPTDISALVLVDVLNDFLRQATELGYHLPFISDGVVEFTDDAHQAAIRISYPTFGHEVLTVEEFLSAVR
jgi:phosphosulfolactate synthase (CoM biosynthesis protein A)